MSAPSSPTASSFVTDTPGPAVDLIDQHRRLRARLRWVLLVGAALLLLLIYQLATYPERAALRGYRYQQVGVQPDSTWWILAYRDGKAEILFSRDTARGWQRHELGVDSSQARSLALNWGGKALLVGDGGAVRVYDAQFRLLDSVRHPFGQQLDARWVATNADGQRAVVIGGSGQMQRTVDGGASWMQVDTLGGLVLDTLRSSRYQWKRAAFGSNDELDLASSYLYQRFYPTPELNNNHLSINTSTLISSGGIWSTAAVTVPIIYFEVSTQGTPRLLRQDGSVETGAVYYASSKFGSQFPLSAGLIDAAFSPGQSGHCLLISPTRVFAGRLGGPFSSAEPEESDSSQLTPPKPAASSKVPSNASASGSTTPAGRPSKSTKTPATTKAKAVLNKRKPQPKETPKTNTSAKGATQPDTTGAAAIRAKNRAAQAAKSGKAPSYQPNNQSPIQQSPINPANQAMPQQNQSAPAKGKE